MCAAQKIRDPHLYILIKRMILWFWLLTLLVQCVCGARRTHLALCGDATGQLPRVAFRDATRRNAQLVLAAAGLRRAPTGGVRLRLAVFVDVSLRRGDLPHPLVLLLESQLGALALTNDNEFSVTLAGHTLAADALGVLHNRHGSLLEFTLDSTACAALDAAALVGASVPLVLDAGSDPHRVSLATQLCTFIDGNETQTNDSTAEENDDGSTRIIEKRVGNNFLIAFNFVFRGFSSFLDEVWVEKRCRGLWGGGGGPFNLKLRTPRES